MGKHFPQILNQQTLLNICHCQNLWPRLYTHSRTLTITDLPFPCYTISAYDQSRQVTAASLMLPRYDPPTTAAAVLYFGLATVNLYNRAPFTHTPTYTPTHKHTHKDEEEHQTCGPKIGRAHV